LSGDLLRSWHTHPAALVAALLAAESATLAFAHEREAVSSGVT
jgi:hypothetical protein